MKTFVVVQKDVNPISSESIRYHEIEAVTAHITADGKLVFYTDKKDGSNYYHDEDIVAAFSHWENFKIKETQ